MSAIPARLDRSATEKPAADQWGRLVAEGRAARAQADGGRWRIGHLADAVERTYRSAALQRFAADIGESYSTVRRYRWVVNRYEPGIRFRFPGLSFSHFQAVAGVPGRVAWLERAELGAWSVDRLIKESRGRETPEGPPAASRLRGSIGGAVRSLELLESVEDAELAAAGREWLLEALEALAGRVESLQSRLAAASKGRTTSLNRHKVTGRAKQAAAARNGSANGKARSSAKGIPVNPF